jgi:threonine/homoserine/homoserine lactone efflux protein
MDEITLYLPGLLLAFSAFLVAIVSPGPNMLAVMGASMSAGRQPGIAVALGVVTGSVCWASLTVTGLSALLAAYAQALTAIKIAGGLYLLWLAFKAFRSAASAQEIHAAPTGAQRGVLAFYLRGLAIQMTNPKAILAWIAIVSLGMQAAAPLWVSLALVLGTGVLSLFIYTAYALAFSSARAVRLYGRARRWIQATLGAVFCFAGYKLLTSRP